MFKSLITLFRGAASAAEEEFVDRNALLILDQQIRDAADGSPTSRAALRTSIAGGGAGSPTSRAALRTSIAGGGSPRPPKP
jgi:hypothetical protein